MNRVLSFALLGFGLMLTQPALSCDMHKEAAGKCSCKDCGNSCSQEKMAKNGKACGCGGAHGAKDAAPAATDAKQKPAS